MFMLDIIFIVQKNSLLSQVRRHKDEAACAENQLKFPLYFCVSEIFISKDSNLLFFLLRIFTV